jgi:hypothetical protein
MHDDINPDSIWKSKTDYRNLSIILLALAAMIILYGQVDSSATPYSQWDLDAYKAIAQNAPSISSDIMSPFAYRILGPYLAGLLPFPVETSFHILAGITSLICLAFIYSFYRRVGIDGTVASSIVIMILLNRNVIGFPLWDSFQINDLLTLLYIPILFESLLERKWIIFTAVMILGALTRETFLLIIPAAIFFQIESQTIKREWGKLVAAIFPAVILFILIRILIFPIDGQTPIGAFMANSVKLVRAGAWFRATINTFAPLSLLPIIFYKETIRFFRKRKYLAFFVLFTFLSSLFGSNTERLIAPSYIVFYWVVGLLFQKNIELKRIMIPLIIPMVFMASFHHYIGRFLLPDRNITIIVSLVTLSVVTMSSFFIKRRAQAFKNRSFSEQSNGAINCI